jgi:hypothetical protein
VAQFAKCRLTGITRHEGSTEFAFHDESMLLVIHSFGTVAQIIYYPPKEARTRQ